jgi:hypothetical protein
MLQARARLLVTVGLLLWAQAFTPPGHAATLATVNPFARNDPSQLFFTPECNAELHGRIDAGEAEEMAAKLKAFLPTIEAAAGKPKQGQFLALCLNSPGGDLREAVRIGEIFKGWMMVVPAEKGRYACRLVRFCS